MLIERAWPEVAYPGQTILIHGSHFGPNPGSKITAINLGRVNQMRVIEWSDRLIRALIPSDLAPGNYRLLIYYDGSFRTSSNSLELTIR